MEGRDEAVRWINLALKLLVNRDLVGTKTFAIRAKEADPTTGYVEEILAVVDTLMAGQQQINGRYDWYGVLQVGRMCGDAEMVAGQYRRLALLLNPQRNGLPFAEEAFGLVTEAWSVLSNPLRKSLYDNELSWLDSGASGGVRVQQHQFLPMQSHSQQQSTQVVSPVRVQPHQHQQQHHHHQQQQQPQPHVVTPVIGQPQPRQQQQPQQQVHYLPQFQPRPQPQPQPQPQAQPQPQPRPQTQSRPQAHQTQPRGQPQQQKEREQGPQVQQQKEPQQRPQGQQPQQRLQENASVQEGPHPPVWKTPSRNEEEEEEVEVEVEVEEDEVVPDPLGADEAEVSTFWTACPYCYHLFEYLKEYEDCTLRCQIKNCRRAFHGSAVAAPPEIKSSKEASFCCWGFFPVGATPIFLNSEKNKSGVHSWLPFSPMFPCPMDPRKGAAPVAPNGGFGGASNRKSVQAKPKAVIYDDDEYALMDLSDLSDDSDADWRSNGIGRRKKRGRGRPPKRKSSLSKSSKRRTAEKSTSAITDAGDHARGSNRNTQDAFANEGAADASESGVTIMSIKSGSNGNGSLLKKASGKNPKDLGKLDLNVEFNNEVEEAVSTKSGMTNAGASGVAVNSTAAGPSNGVEENIEAEGMFFEGLDEFLNSLPILSAVGDDKVKAA
uniref:J domain-containing protein n=1 Tax=Kalanchoe fedtschenkoi TaxID=63787 RepID=A0A7N0TVW5_KALFE